MPDGRKRAVILGGGISGLSTGWHLAERHGWQVTVLEHRERLGGISSTLTRDGYSYDLGPHKVYTQIPGVMEELDDLLGPGAMRDVPKTSSVYLKGKFFAYPVGIKELITKMPPPVSARLALGTAGHMARSLFGKGPDETYEQYVVNRFGRAMYELIFEPQAKKIWGDPKKLSAELGRTRISFPGIWHLIKGLIVGIKGKPEMSADVFHYPKGGCVLISERMAERIRAHGGEVHLKAEPLGVALPAGEGPVIVTYRDHAGAEQSLEADALITTIPPAGFVSLLRPTPPADVVQAAEELKFRSLILVYLLVDKDKLRDEAWSFYPEGDVVFNRLSEQKSFDPGMVPAGRTLLCAELARDPGDPVYAMKDVDLVEMVKADLDRIGFLGGAAVLESFVIKLDDVYPVYELGYDERLERLTEYIDSFRSIVPTGRPGLFNYNNMDHCLDMGRITADYVAGDEPGEWKQVRERFRDYRIVD